MTAAPTAHRAAWLDSGEWRLSQWHWLAGGLGLAFGVPFMLADVLSVSRDLYYAL